MNFLLFINIDSPKLFDFVPRDELVKKFSGFDCDKKFMLIHKFHLSNRFSALKRDAH